MGENIEDVEIIERYLILLLGSVDRPIPSSEHLQKELFVLSKSNPKIAEIIFFDKHYKGPYSSDLNDITKEPAYHSDAYELDRYQRLHITSRGKEIYEKLISENIANPRFKDFLSMIKMVRELYEKLTVRELLFLIYITYDEYTQKSSISKELLSPENKEKFSKKLLEKGLITEKRYNELVVS